jgi:hypothetical protein
MCTKIKIKENRYELVGAADGGDGVLISVMPSN